jgi:F-type H+-transporting ATPase subunit gamma
MSERHDELTARIEAVRQLGSVVNVMRGTAGVRAAQARQGIEAVRGHAEVLAGAIGRVLALLPAGAAGGESAEGRTARVVFTAEQGFVGGFSERILDALGDDLTSDLWLLIGTRGTTLASERGLSPAWTAAMPLHISGIPALADRIVDALFRLVARRGVRRVEAVWSTGAPSSAGADPVGRRTLLPLRSGDFPGALGSRRPLLYRSPAALLDDLTEDHVHAQLCEVGLRAFGAEQEVRMAVMTSAHRQVERRMKELESRRRRLRQQEITAEILELSTGLSAEEGDSP